MVRKGAHKFPESKKHYDIHFTVIERGNKCEAKKQRVEGDRQFLCSDFGGQTFPPLGEFEE